MQFYTSEWGKRAEVGPNSVYLLKSGWDDWFKFSTTYELVLLDGDGRSHRIGETKIGKFGLKPAGQGLGVPGESRLPGPPAQFAELPEDYFSLGQEPEFYEKLSAISADVRDEVLSGLRDIAYFPDLLVRAQTEPVTRVSLLRYVPLLTVQRQYARLAQGGARLTPYNLRFRVKSLGGALVQFEVDPASQPPTNIHVIIGRNGVGKSTFLNALATYLVKRGKTSPLRPENDDEAVANLVSVSFSAFDSFEPLTSSQDRTKGLSYHYVGLKVKDDSERIKGPSAIASEMTKSARACLQGDRKARWARSLRLLENDPIFAEAGISESMDGEDEDFLSGLGATFSRLSSGHKLVLLTVTRLVETVAERSLVLLDEPEAHLHPPLLSAFIRALSDLLSNRNGLAVVATHSPVVLQEVPSSCVWTFDRRGEQTTVERPRIETFGENVGTCRRRVNPGHFRRSKSERLRAV